MDIEIRGGTLLCVPATGEVIENGSVHVRDGRITYAGPHKAPTFTPERVIDASDTVVMPGLYNLHTHAAMNILRGFSDDCPLQEWLFDHIFPAEEKLTPEMVYWSTMGALCEMARAGIVCFNDMYDFCDSIARATEKSGMRAVLSRGVTSRFGPWDDKVREAEEFFDKWNGQGRIHVWFAPHAQYTNVDDAVRHLGELAKNHGTGIHAHVSETKKEHEDCIRETGMTPIAYFDSLGLLDVPFIGAHCVWVTDEDIQLMAGKGAVVASCPRSNMKLASGFAPLEKMRKGGVRISLGTDSAASNNRLSIMSEMEAAAYTQKALLGDPAAFTASQMLDIACTQGALALGQNGGTLEAGKNADLILVSRKGMRWLPDYSIPSSLVYAAQDCSVALTMVGGDILFENGQVTFADEEEVAERIALYSQDL